MRQTYALIIPALNEEESIGMLLRRIPLEIFAQFIVVDNGSRDQTAAVSSAAGAQVVSEPRRGYGQACWTGIQCIQGSVTAIAFMDADCSDDPDDLVRLLQRFDEDQWDMVLGSRVMGNPESGSLKPLQRFGNWLSTLLIAMIWQVRFTDLGPMRVVRRDSLEKFDLRDRTFGWTVEMQARAAQLRLRVCEVPVHYHRRAHGRSKISGTVLGSLRAGAKILWTILRCCIIPLRSGARGL
jgi:glycosyltransferase involved in cell wall biosynthesis